MSNLYMFISSSFSFSLFFFFISFASSSSFNSTHKCSPQQALDLLLFKETMSSVNYPDYNGDYIDSNCQYWLESGYHPIMMNWNENTDCCKWDGVTCNHFTGDVIGIDLSCGMLRGVIHPNTTLFHLPYLQKLNLAFNDFSYSQQIPREIGRLSNSLTHLNLSRCLFTGEAPMEILFLPKLVSLDLSSNFQMQIQPDILKNLLRNSTNLREILLAQVDIGWVLPTYLNISSTIKSIDLSWTGLQGKLPDNIFSLQYLEKIDFSWNNGITGTLPKANTSNNIPLEWLDLSFANLSGDIPNSAGHLKSLNYLDLFSCGLVGSLPNSLVNLRHLTTLDLSHNIHNGSLPSFLFMLPFIEDIDLDHNMFSGGLTSEFFNCQSLKKLSLRHNQFDGQINAPPSFIQLSNLNYLDLSYNNFSGSLDLNTLLSTLTNLQQLDLSYSGIIVMNNNGTSYVNPEFRYLRLASCKLSVFPESLRSMKNIQRLDLSYNNIHGRIPDWAGEIGGNRLSDLDLSNNFISGLPPFQWDGIEYISLHSNNIQGPFPPSICNLRNVIMLDLSYNNFSGVIPQCLANTSSFLDYFQVNSNQIEGPLPSSICNLSSLTTLDISNNRFSGVIPKCLVNISSLKDFYVNSNQIQEVFPLSICKMRTLQMLDISDNSFSGVIPQCLGNISSSLWYLNVKSNRIQGSFPSSICNMNSLLYLDMSNNSFVGTIPQCFGNLSSSIVMVDMGNNDFHGLIPNVYDECGRLKGLILNGNHLQGEIPSSFSKCKYLKVLDLGNNQLNGTFPHWLGDLPELQVLVLKSNMLHGPVETFSSNKSEFPSILVLDLSHNGFTGILPRKYFENFNAMMNIVKEDTPPKYLYLYKYYSLLIVVKGVDQVFEKLFVGYTIIDLSNNNFEGEIPDIIGHLTSLKVINLSYNILTGQIPESLGNVSEIESLDLSWNQLTGEIPQSLADLTFLGFLNLSQNHLVGRIPSGTQFSTFGTSFGGNPGLCGLPLPKKCEHQLEPKLEVNGDTKSGFTWRVVVLGYGCGTAIGLLMGYVMLSTGKPKWFNAIADDGEHMIRTRGNKIRYVYIGK